MKSQSKEFNFPGDCSIADEEQGKSRKWKGEEGEGGGKGGRRGRLNELIRASAITTNGSEREELMQ